MADDKDKKEPWLNWLALTTIVFAVCATLSTFKGGSYSTRSVMSQSLSSSQWAFYQAKSIKSYLHEIQAEELETELVAGQHTLPEAAQRLYRERAAEYRRSIARYEQEMATIQRDARSLEERRDHAQRHSQMFGLAVIFLQIAILMSSVAALLKRQPLWWFGMLSGVFGVYHFVAGFFAR